jgi:hypothetical protein
MELPIRARKDGSYVVDSESHARIALDGLDAFDNEIARIREQSGLNRLEEVRAKIKAAVDEYALEHEGYQDERWKLTRVQGFKRAWNVDKLAKILPKSVFKHVTKIEADPAKIDDYVRKGTIKLETIEPAYEETPQKAYVKWTRATESSASKGAAEADSLAAKLG